MVATRYAPNPEMLTCFAAPLRESTVSGALSSSFICSGVDTKTIRASGARISKGEPSDCICNSQRSHNYADELDKADFVKLMTYHIRFR